MPTALVCLQELIAAVDEVQGTYLITADHGNAEDMVQRDKNTKKALMEGGKPRMLTSHTLNPVSSPSSSTCMHDRACVRAKSSCSIWAICRVCCRRAARVCSARLVQRSSSRQIMLP